eukprot:73458-Alexandrium_andersonii.AAC.1
MDIRVHASSLHIVDNRPPLGAELGVRQPAQSLVGHLAAQAMLALERRLPEDPTELHAQLVQDSFRIERQAALAARAIDERL